MLQMYARCKCTPEISIMANKNICFITMFLLRNVKIAGGYVFKYLIATELMFCDKSQL